MSEDRLAYLKVAPPLLFEEGDHKAGGVDGVSLFVANHQAEAFTTLKPVDHLIEVSLEIAQTHPLFGQIDPFSARGQTTHQGQVATITTHDLDDKAASRGNRRLFDPVDCIDDAIEGRIGTDAQFGAGEVIVDRGGQADHRNIEGREDVALAEELVTGLVATPAADHEQSVDTEAFNISRNLVEFRTLRDFSVGTEIRTARCCPTTDAHPTHLGDITLNQALEPIPHPQHDMALVNAHAHCCAHRGVHTWGRATRVNDRET